MEATDIADLVELTLNKIPAAKLTDAASEYQDYLVLPRMLRGDQVVKQTGTEVEFKTLVEDDTNFGWIGIHQRVNTAITDGAIGSKVPWRMGHSSWAYDVNEIAMNADPSRIVSIASERQAMSVLGIHNGMEKAFMSKPTDSDDKYTPYGVPMWIVKNTTEGFTGSNPSGFSAGVGGVDADVYTGCRNWSYKYTDISKADLIAGWRKAFVYTDFKSPIKNIVGDYDTGDERAYLTNYNVIGPMELILEAQNDNLGPDVDRYGGELRFRQRPVTHMRYLDSDSSNPVYGINYGVFKTVILKGREFKRGAPRRAPLQPNDWIVDYDFTFNWVCKNRRKQFVLYA